MVKNVIIICNDSPIGSNSAIESIRMGAGISAVGDLDDIKIIFIGDSVLLLKKNYNPNILGMDDDANVFRMLDLADIEVFVLDEAMKNLGMKESDLIEFNNVQSISIQEISKFILDADIVYNY